MPLPRVSVIIPVYNEERYITACLTSLIRQKTNIPYEIIVVDNNSRDKTILRTKQFPGVRIIREKRQGLAFARNTGAKSASAQILVFVDADCIVSDCHIATIHKHFSDHPDAAGITGPYIYRDGNPLVRFTTDKLRYFQTHFFISRLLFGVQMLLGGNSAFRKKIFHELGGFNESITDINDPEDLDMAIRCARRNKIILYTEKIAVDSSFRRMKRAMMRDAPKRFINQYRKLISFAFTG